MKSDMKWPVQKERSQARKNFVTYLATLAVTLSTIVGVFALLACYADLIRST